VIKKTANIADSEIIWASNFMSNNKFFFLPLIKKVQLTNEVWSFYFKRTGEEPDFKPGQYYEMKLDIKNPDERGDSRVFTICSSPTEKEYVMFTTKIIESSFKKTLLNLSLGTIVQFDGPWDDLDVNLDDPSPKIFFAGGIGITPFHSILKYCVDSNLNLPIILFASWQMRSDVLFHEFFRETEEKLSAFTYVPTISQEQEDFDWNGERGRIDQSVIERHVVKKDLATYYIVGPERFLKGIEEILLGMRISQEKIFAESFSGY